MVVRVVVVVEHHTQLVDIPASWTAKMSNTWFKMVHTSLSAMVSVCHLLFVSAPNCCYVVSFGRELDAILRTAMGRSRSLTGHLRSRPF